MNENVDCAIVGAGPAGLTAAIYLARYRRNICIFDTGESRALKIPKSRNYPGFPNGVSGSDLLNNLRMQASEYSISILPHYVERISGKIDRFVLSLGKTDVFSKRIILATGLIDKTLADLGIETCETPQIRYCPICDGYEATDQRIAVIGSIQDTKNKAKFLRTYSNRVSIIAIPQSGNLSGDERELDKLGVTVFTSKIKAVEPRQSDVKVLFEDGREEVFNVIYPVLGCKVKSELLVPFGAKHNDVGCLEVDDHQQTSIPGIFAVGDVVSDLHQISVGIGHAALAATQIHNQLPQNFR